MNRSRKIDLIINTLILAFEAMEDAQNNTRLDAVHKAAIEARFTELIAAIEIYQSDTHLTK